MFQCYLGEHTFCTAEMKYFIFITTVLWHTEDKDYILLGHAQLMVGKWVGNFTDMALDYAYLIQIAG
jgi:hypothetical protein